MFNIFEIIFMLDIFIVVISTIGVISKKEPSSWILYLWLISLAVLGAIVVLNLGNYLFLGELK